MKKIYLAIPYSGMQESSYEQATELTAKIIKEGLGNVFSPITHSHPLHKSSVKLPGDWQFWEAVDKQFLDWAHELWIIIPKEGLGRVLDSKGVKGEYIYAKERNIPVKVFNIIVMETGKGNEYYCVRSHSEIEKQIHETFMT